MKSEFVAVPPVEYLPDTALDAALAQIITISPSG